MRAGLAELRGVTGFELRSADLYGDAASLAEINAPQSDDLAAAPGPALAAVGLPGRDTKLVRQQPGQGGNAVYVTHAVRHEAFATDPAVHVQQAVRASQQEAQARDLRAVSSHGASLGIQHVFDPFAPTAAAGADAQRVPADVKTSAAATAEAAAKHASSHPNSRDNADLRPNPSRHRPTVAPGFAAQLQHSAGQFRARLSGSATPRPPGPPSDPSPVSSDPNTRVTVATR